MRWSNDGSMEDVEDRRAEGGAGLGGGGVPVFGLLRLFSIFGWKGLLVGLVLAGGFAVCTQMGGGGGAGVTNNRPAASSPAEDELSHFVEFVFHDTQKTWAAKIPNYQHAHLVLFRNAIRSGCGTASTSVGPFYCPNDQKVYIDLSFYQLLRDRLGAPGDFAQAYVIAHEMGHHVQNELGIFKGHGDSVKIELQADCLAGAWAQDAEKRGELENGDLGEAINAASQIGDDTLQRRETGVVRPETFTHGTSAQRTASFRAGYQGGPSACGVNLP